MTHSRLFTQANFINLKILLDLNPDYKIYANSSVLNLKFYTNKNVNFYNFSIEIDVFIKNIYNLCSLWQLDRVNKVSIYAFKTFIYYQF